MTSSFRGFLHRAAYAMLFAIAGWYSCIYPPAFSWQYSVQRLLCYALTYPIAVVGQVTRPFQGMDLLFIQRSHWCHHCSAQELLWYHARFAVPVYIALFYVPAALKWVAARDGSLFRRVVIGMLMFVLGVSTFFVLTESGERAGYVRAAGLWLVVLGVAAGFAWSAQKLPWRIAGIAAAVILGTWVILFSPAQVDSEWDRHYVSDYFAYLLVLAAGVTLFLGTTEGLMNVFDRVRATRSSEVDAGTPPSS